MVALKALVAEIEEGSPRARARTLAPPVRHFVAHLGRAAHQMRLLL